LNLFEDAQLVWLHRNNNLHGIQLNLSERLMKCVNSLL